MHIILCTAIGGNGVTLFPFSPECDIFYKKRNRGIKPCGSSFSSLFCSRFLLGFELTVNNKEVYILDATAAIYMIPMDRYNKNFDMFLKGNLGSKGQDGIIEHIKKLENVQLLIKEKPRNWQTPNEVIEYVENNWENTGKILNFNVYEKR